MKNHTANNTGTANESLASVWESATTIIQRNATKLENLKNHTVSKWKKDLLVFKRCKTLNGVIYKCEDTGFLFYER